MLLVQIHNPHISLYELKPDTFGKQLIDTVDYTQKKLTISPNKFMAFQQDYPDIDNSGIGVGFLHLRKLFPCIVPPGRTVPEEVPRCAIHTYDEGGFNQGRPVLEITTQSVKVGGLANELPLYAFGVEGCPKFTIHETDGCLRPEYKFAIVCHLPGELCRDKA